MDLGSVLGREDRLVRDLCVLRTVVVEAALRLHTADRPWPRQIQPLTHHREILCTVRKRHNLPRKNVPDL